MIKIAQNINTGYFKSKLYLLDKKYYNSFGLVSRSRPSKRGEKTGALSSFLNMGLLFVLHVTLCPLSPHTHDLSNSCTARLFRHFPKGFLKIAIFE